MYILFNENKKKRFYFYEEQKERSNFLFYLS